MPISLYTGTPNITVPILEIESGGVTLPISISYHARGNRVDELASRVGLGWTLNCGGMISRQIRGGADEGAYGYLNFDTNSEEFFNEIQKRQSVYSTNADHPEADFIPDQFFYNVNNLSGKFILDRHDNHKALIQQFSGTKIDFGFRDSMITDDKGNKYYFGSIETREEQSEIIYKAAAFHSPSITNGNGDQYQTSWYLTSIETASGREIVFEYEPEVTNFCRRLYDAQVKPGEFINTLPTDYMTCFSIVTSSQYRIKNIIFDTGRVNFTYSEVREDLEGGEALTEVKLLNNNSETIKSVNLEYIYTTAPSDGNQHSYISGSEPKAAKRMFLKSVKVKSGTQSLPPYRFDYNNTVPLPNRHSNSQDYFGYYNGKNNGRFLKLFYADDLNARAVDTDKAMAGILTKITYPEGGSTTFNYEHNKVINTFSKRLLFPNTNPVKDTLITLGNFHVGNLSNGVFSRKFTVGDKLIGGIRAKVTFYGSAGDTCAESPNNNHNCKFEVNLTKGLETPIPLFKGAERLVATKSGNYTLTVRPKVDNYVHTMNDYSFAVDISWNETLADGDSLIYAAGVRIKKIEHKESDTAVPIIRTYDYIDPATGQTSGLLLGLPNFLSIRHITTGGWLILDPYGCVPGQPLSTYQGNSLGYETVTEYLDDGSGELGKTEHVFSLIPDSGLYYEFPYHPPTDNEWLRGRELKTTYYKKRVDGIYKPSRMVENQYLFGDFIDDFDGNPSVWMFTPIPIKLNLEQNMLIPSLKYFKDSKMFRLPLTILCPRITYNPITGLLQVSTTLIDYKTYHMTGGTADLLYTKTTDYFNDSTKLVNQTNYKYNYLEHYNPESISTKMSDGSVKSTKFLYAGDSEMNNEPAVNDLRSKNMVSTPLLTQTFRDTDLIASQKTLYWNWGNIFGNIDPVPQLAPQFLQTSKGSATLETRIEYVDVDQFTGNPLEIKQSDGMSICYIWGYNKTVPIAKIENATSSQVVTALGLGLGLKSVNEGHFSAINALRNTLPNAMVTTMTYIPHVGLHTVTNPNGQKTNYFYDAFNRLETVRDHLDRVLTKNEYYYASPTN